MLHANENLNPYTLQFSFSPPQLIKRTIITEEIINNFTRPVPTYRGMFISGVRGSGKTVLLGNIRKEIDAMKDWVTVDLNPEDQGRSIEEIYEARTGKKFNLEDIK